MTCKHFKFSKKRPTKNTLTSSDLAAIAKNPCCEHVSILLERIQQVMTERDSWKVKFNGERNIVNRLARQLK